MMGDGKRRSGSGKAEREKTAPKPVTGAARKPAPTLARKPAPRSARTTKAGGGATPATVNPGHGPAHTKPAVPGRSRRRLEQELLEAARQAQSQAFAPYSQFPVGAAVLDGEGRVHRGCNVENASFGLTVCAERNAVAAAVVQGARQIRAVAVVTPTDEPGTPCGACRQVLAELAGPETPVLLAGRAGTVRRSRLGSLLPQSFRFREEGRPKVPARGGRRRRTHLGG